jgi:hypothetical protein
MSKSLEQKENQKGKEVWKDIKGYEGRYQVSDNGRVKSLERTFIDKLGHKQHIKERIRQPSTDKDGYLYVLLYKGSGRGKNSLFIALFAKHFTKTRIISLV